MHLLDHEMIIFIVETACKVLKPHWVNVHFRIKTIQIDINRVKFRRLEMHVGIHVQL